MRAAFLLSVCALSLSFAGCDGTPAVPLGGDAGAAGDTSAEAGASGESPSADAGAAGVGTCEHSGSGEIEVEVTGLPDGVDASVILDQPFSGGDREIATASRTFSGVGSGPWGVLSKRVYDEDPIVRTAYEPQVSVAEFCLPDGGSQTVTVTYKKIAPSNRLWMLGGLGPEPAERSGFAAFSSESLDMFGAPPQAETPDVSVGTSLAFDADGNAWAGGADATLVRYPASALGEAGTPDPDFVLNVPAIDCIPQLKGIALDRAGNVWLSGCGKKVVRIGKPAAADSSADAVDVEPSVTLTGFDTQNEDLAFDSAGNLWVATQEQILRFDLARLGADDADAADLALNVTTDDTEPKALTGDFLAFDKSGNLWVSDFEGNQIFEIKKADLSGTGTKTRVAVVHVSVDILAVMSRPAFDDGSALWLPLQQHTFAKLTPEQLTVSSDAGSPTIPDNIIFGVSLGYGESLAFFPAPSGLPLASSQP